MTLVNAITEPTDNIFRHIEKLCSSENKSKDFNIVIIKSIEFNANKIENKNNFGFKLIKASKCRNKKKNPKFFQSILDGYFYKDIKEIILCLNNMESIMNETWANYEQMKYPNGTEF